MNRIRSTHVLPRAFTVLAGIFTGLLGLLLLAGPGCYRHVVRAEGSAGKRYDVHEPAYDENEKLRLFDKPLFGGWGDDDDDNDDDDK